jgi:hypothetical protein
MRIRRIYNHHSFFLGPSTGERRLSKYMQQPETRSPDPEVLPPCQTHWGYDDDRLWLAGWHRVCMVMVCMYVRVRVLVYIYVEVPVQPPRQGRAIRLGLALAVGRVCI